MNGRRDPRSETSNEGDGEGEGEGDGDGEGIGGGGAAGGGRRSQPSASFHFTSLHSTPLHYPVDVHDAQAQHCVLLVTESARRVAARARAQIK